MPPAPTRGGRGGASSSSLKFKPKTSTRRSAADREADEKAEAAKIKKEQDAVDRERKRVEKRAERGRGGRERGRGGATMLGGGMSHLTGAISGVGRSGGWGGGGAGGSRGGSGGGGGGGWSGGSGGGGGARVKMDGIGGPAIERMEIDGRRLINIDDIATINLVSDDDDEDEDITDKGKGKGPARDRDHKPKRTPGLPPVRIVRHEHVPRRMKVNIDLTTLPDEASKEAAKAVISSSTSDPVSTSTVPIKIEDDTVAPPAVPPGVKIKRESDLQSPTRARKTRNALLKGTPAVPTTIDLDDKPVPPSEMPGGSRGEEIGGQIGTVMVQRPLWVPEDCNFVPQPRPAGWESKEDAANWERNVHKAWIVYNTLATKEGKRKGTKYELEAMAAEEQAEKIAPEAKKNVDGDVEMKDADAADAAGVEETKPEPVPKEKDGKDGVVFLFQIPPGIPGLEGLKTASDIAREKEELELLSSAPTMVTKPSLSATTAKPATSRAKSTTTTTTIKSKPSASSEPKIKTEPTIKPDPDDPAPQSSSSSSASSIPVKPGYIGDLIIYNTGAAQLSWGGLPLRVKAGTQSDQLQHVLLTGKPVTKELAEEAERDKEKVKKEGGGGEKGGEGEGEKEKEKEKAFCLGTIGGYLTCVPDFKEFFGDKWKYHC